VGEREISKNKEARKLAVHQEMREITVFGLILAADARTGSVSFL
jgi:hypothetical protein